MTITQIENELQRGNERLHQALKLNAQAIGLISQQPTLVQSLGAVNPRVIRLILALVEKDNKTMNRDLAKSSELVGIKEWSGDRHFTEKGLI
jgi:ABC-type methionine transport system ATPase subunit